MSAGSAINIATASEEERSRPAGSRINPGKVHTRAPSSNARPRSAARAQPATCPRRRRRSTQRHVLPRLLRLSICRQCVKSCFTSTWQVTSTSDMLKWTIGDDLLYPPLLYGRKETVHNTGPCIRDAPLAPAMYIYARRTLGNVIRLCVSPRARSSVCILCLDFAITVLLSLLTRFTISHKHHSLHDRL